jgi:hypothetical protein
MAKKKGNEDWWIAGLLVAGGLALLYYAQTGVGKENDSALIPNSLEGKIDALIAALNERFGKHWLDFGVVVLKRNLQSTLPTSLVSLVNIVATVENMAKGRMTSYEKQQLAVQMAGGR